jgi:hypothetical protein
MVMDSGYRIKPGTGPAGVTGIETFYDFICFGVWGLFGIWDLTNFVLEKIVPLYRSGFCKSLLGRNTIYCRVVTGVV